ncbi:DUF4435 domain-containing protein [Chryseobacterium fluminis]|uniref:DUF4435 domain-containing protein n=1 Tax=Chryseobacterium fluminis TaxID=2983606 RepID=UPI00225B0B73|nr:DUF4435 domain-containing protein [Chryseobacterium sp. MMS21-Ot14]UZT97383.1 DUF4435 domain-containing protein [Chryseobacterium sp. MMS21-Ot14]
MNNTQIGFPEFTDSFLLGQDILYTQFNEVEFYIEDTDQEHLYFNILKKLFPDLVFEKIFPLNGKSNIISSAGINHGNKKKIYIADLDFDLILSRVSILDNLFYLRKYSIENYLFEKESIYEIIRIKDPKLKNHQIDLLLNYKFMQKQSVQCLKELACVFIIIQEKSLNHPYYKINNARDFDFSTPYPCYRMNFITDYYDEIQILLKNINSRFSLSNQLRKFKKYFKTQQLALSNIPGKYLLLFYKEYLQSLNLISQMTLESFTYLLSKDINDKALLYLKTEINSYIKS